MSTAASFGTTSPATTRVPTLNQPRNYTTPVSSAWGAVAAVPPQVESSLPQTWSTAAEGVIGSGSPAVVVAFNVTTPYTYDTPVRATATYIVPTYALRLSFLAAYTVRVVLVRTSGPSIRNVRAIAYGDSSLSFRNFALRSPNTTACANNAGNLSTTCNVASIAQDFAFDLFVNAPAYYDFPVVVTLHVRSSNAVAREAKLRFVREVRLDDPPLVLAASPPRGGKPAAVDPQRMPTADWPRAANATPAAPFTPVPNAPAQPPAANFALAGIFGGDGVSCGSELTVLLITTIVCIIVAAVWLVRAAFVRTSDRSAVNKAPAATRSQLKVLATTHGYLGALAPCHVFCGVEHTALLYAHLLALYCVCALFVNSFGDVVIAGGWGRIALAGFATASAAGLAPLLNRAFVTYSIVDKRALRATTDSDAHDPRDLSNFGVQGDGGAVSGVKNVGVGKATVASLDAIGFEKPARVVASHGFVGVTGGPSTPDADDGGAVQGLFDIDAWDDANMATPHSQHPLSPSQVQLAGNTPSSAANNFGSSPPAASSPGASPPHTSQHASLQASSAPSTWASFGTTGGSTPSNGMLPAALSLQHHRHSTARHRMSRSNMSGEDLIAAACTAGPTPHSATTGAAGAAVPTNASLCTVPHEAGVTYLPPPTAASAGSSPQSKAVNGSMATARSTASDPSTAAHPEEMLERTTASGGAGGSAPETAVGGSTSSAPLSADGSAEAPIDVDVDVIEVDHDADGDATDEPSADGVFSRSVLDHVTVDARSYTLTGYAALVVVVVALITLLATATRDWCAPEHRAFWQLVGISVLLDVFGTQLAVGGLAIGFAWVAHNPEESDHDDVDAHELDNETEKEETAERAKSCWSLHGPRVELHPVHGQLRFVGVLESVSDCSEE
jgi:hypothetical protein